MAYKIEVVGVANGPPGEKSLIISLFDDERTGLSLAEATVPIPPGSTDQEKRTLVQRAGKALVQEVAGKATFDAFVGTILDPEK